MPLYKKSSFASKSRTQSSFNNPCQSQSSSLDILKEDYKNLKVPIKKRSTIMAIKMMKSQESVNNNKLGEENMKKPVQSTHEVKGKKHDARIRTQSPSSLNDSLSQCVKTNIELIDKLNNSIQSITDSSVSETAKYSQTSNSESVLSPDLFDVCCSNLKLIEKKFPKKNPKPALQELPSTSTGKIDLTANPPKETWQKRGGKRSSIDVNGNSKVKNKENIYPLKKQKLHNTKNIVQINNGKKQELNRSKEVKWITKKEKVLFKDYIKEMNHLQQTRNIGLYVYCDACNKVRFLTDCKDPLQLPDKWFCYMNPDPQYNSCSDPEVVIPPEEEECLINNKYNAGSIVWAKLGDFPWWPAMVEDDPDVEWYFWLDDECSLNPSYYHVTFFDRVSSRKWIRTENLAGFETNLTSGRFKVPKTSQYYHGIQAAIAMARRACKLPIAKRLEEFGFIKNHYKEKNKLPKSITRCFVVEDNGHGSKKRRIIGKHNRKNCKKGKVSSELDVTLSIASEEISMYLDEDGHNLLDGFDINDIPL